MRVAQRARKGDTPRYAPNPMITTPHTARMIARAALGMARPPKCRIVETAMYQPRSPSSWPRKKAASVCHRTREISKRMRNAEPIVTHQIQRGVANVRAMV